MNLQERDFFWLNKPRDFSIQSNKIEIETEPETDYWQRTYYGFQNDNAPALLIKKTEKFFSFFVKTEFESKKRFDQCGVIVYLNSDNWIKGSIEYENDELQRLGSVVTNYGYSDWATVDIPTTQKEMYYRLSRRENDFCIENSLDGIHYKQMRIAHLFTAHEEISVGIYACSPSDSSFKAMFSEIAFTKCTWSAHN